MVDPDTGAELGPMTEGEVMVRGPQVMLGYLNNPTATQEAFTRDGWLKTGGWASVEQFQPVWTSVGQFQSLFGFLCTFPPSYCLGFGSATFLH